MRDNRMIRTVIDKLISNKLLVDENCITFTYFETMVKEGIQKEQEQEFKELAQIKLNNMGYKVYFENEEFDYNDAHRRVQCNEILTAIKLK